MIKNDRQIKEDTNGRIHSLDQSQRSLEKRLRAVERRLSTGDTVNGEIFVPELEFDHENIEQIREQIAELKMENERLNELLKFKAKTKMDLLAAKVIGTDLVPDHSTITIKIHRIINKVA